MGIFTSIVLFILLIISYDLNRKGRISQGISLCTEFIAYWFIIVLAGCFQFFGLYDISANIYFFVIAGSISFFLGYHFFKVKNEKCDKTNNSKTEYLQLSLLFYIVLVISLFIIIKQVILLLPIILSRGMADAREEFQLDDTLILTGPIQILSFYFAKPFVKASIIIIIINSIKTKFTFKSMIVILLSTGIYFFSEGGRAVIMDVFFILFYVLYANKKNLTKKTKKKIIRFVIFISLLPIVATLGRGSDVLKSFYSYYCGSLQFLSQAIELKKNYFDDYLWGFASFQGFIKPITGILQIVGVEKPTIVEDASDFILNAQYTVYDIGPNMIMNYFYTTFGYAYKDAGIIGVIFIHFLFGIMCKYVDIKQSLFKQSVRWLAIKTIFFYCILYTMSYFPFAMYLHSMTLIYVYLITSKIFSRKRFITNLNQ